MYVTSSTYVDYNFIIAADIYNNDSAFEQNTCNALSRMHYGATLLVLAPTSENIPTVRMDRSTSE